MQLQELAHRAAARTLVAGPLRLFNTYVPPALQEAARDAAEGLGADRALPWRRAHFGFCPPARPPRS